MSARPRKAEAEPRTKGASTLSLGLARLAEAGKNLLFPFACLGCGCPASEAEPFCPTCQTQIIRLDLSICRVCGSPLQGQGGPPICSPCKTKPPAFDQARSLALHQGPLAEALRRFKYRRHWLHGAALAGLVNKWAPFSWAARAELVAPVPLHPLRLIYRGFNQAMVLNRQLCRSLPGKLYPALLRRRRHTRPQIGLDPRARRQNVAGAFALGKDSYRLLEGRLVLLLDDVLTTGATVDECARVLKDAGARKVFVFTLSRAPGGEALAGPDS